MYDRDTNNVRVVGGVIVGLGVVLFLLTFLGIIVYVFARLSTNPAAIFEGLLPAILCLLMSITMVACGTQFQRVNFRWRTDLENLRLVWAALFIAMLISAVAGSILLPPLTGLAATVLFLIWAIRGAIIRLTR
jgi:integral membrane sensor domain MASE1